LKIKTKNENVLEIRKLEIRFLVFTKGRLFFMVSRMKGFLCMTKIKKQKNKTIEIKICKMDFVLGLKKFASK